MRTKLTRMIAAVLAMLLVFSCVACGKDAADTAEPSVTPTQGTTAPTTPPSEPQENPTEPSVTQPTDPEAPTDPEVPIEPECPTNPEQPGNSESSEDQKEPENPKPTDPEPSEPEVKNEFFNDKNYEMVEGAISVKARRAYWKDGELVLECFVINGQSYILNWVQVTDITVETPDGQVIAKSYFDYFREDQIRYGNYYIHTFTFPKECVKIPNASLQSLNLKYGLSWNDIDNRYDNQEIAHYPLNEGRLPDSDPAVAQKKVDVRIRWAYWDGNDMKLRLSIANGTDVAITDVSVNSLMMTNTSGLITSTSFGILKDGNGAAVTVEPGRYVDVDATIAGKGTNHELINAQWSILFSNKNLLPAAPDASFDGVTDEQILASLENCRAGRMPMNDDPRYTYMSETRVVGALIDCEYDIAAVEVLYATINGTPCTVYQTHNPKKIKEILDSEEWDAETFGCREILNIFLIESDAPIEVMDNRTNYVIVEHHIMFRVYLTNGEYRDVLYGSDNYILEIFGGGMMSRPEWYE